MTQKEDIEIKPKIIYQEDYRKTRLYKLADEYVDEYVDLDNLRTMEFLYGSECAHETVRNFIHDAYSDGYEDALRDAFLILKQFKEFDGVSFGTFKKEVLNR